MFIFKEKQRQIQIKKNIIKKIKNKTYDMHIQFYTIYYII